MPTVALRERLGKLGWVSPKSKYEKAKGKIPLVPTIEYWGLARPDKTRVAPRNTLSAGRKLVTKS